MGSAARVGLSVERRAVDRLLDSGELDRILSTVASDPRVHDALRRALASDGARELIDSFFDSGLFDHFIERLAASGTLWRLVDQIAQSPAVAAAVSQQSLGFADQVGEAVRDRSRKADRRVARTVAQRFRQQHNGVPPDEPTP